jgi:large subunit ribosomal protein L7A
MPHVVGLKQSRAAVKSGRALRVTVAKDAELRVRQPFETLCRESGVPVEYVETCAALGHACGIEVGAAVVAILKD